MSSDVRKLRSIYRDYGIRGLIRFVCTRVVRGRRHVLYAKRNTGQEGAGTVLTPTNDPNVVVAERSSDLEMSGIECSEAGSLEYIDGIGKGDVVGVFLLENEKVVHRSFLMRHSRTLEILGAPHGSMLLGNAYTQPGFRGRGYHKRSIQARIEVAWRLGAETVVSEAHPDNLASMRALESSGLRRVGSVTVVVVGNRLVFRMIDGDWYAHRVGWCRKSVR
jgi:RimJ/RimL family protein N-acetyltransferase